MEFVEGSLGDTCVCARLLAISLSLVKASSKKAVETWCEDAMVFGFNTYVAVREGRGVPGATGYD